jgi:Cysteine rich repeat
MKVHHILLASTIALVGSIAIAAAQSGPVATACKDDIPKYCAGKEHGPPEHAVRVCLEAHKDNVSAPCKAALEATGGGRQ